MDQIKIWEKSGEIGQLVATAIHDGHFLRKEVAEIMALSEEERRREEDPYTAKWVTVGNIQIIGLYSRFEVDLNRPREKSVYQKPEDAWGLEVWKEKPSQGLVARSLAEYDAFYKEVYSTFSEIEKKFGYFVVYDLHSYNHMRSGPEMSPDDPLANPEVNIGTGTMDRSKWGHLIDRLISDLKNYNFNNRNLDVRENIKFKGGQFSRWIHQTFPDSACSISIEFKKFFMDEWTGKPDLQKLKEISLALQSTKQGIMEELFKLKKK